MGDGPWTIWRPTTWLKNQRTESCEEEGDPFPPITDLCPAVRALILNNLETRDLKIVRQVCRSLMVDTDEMLVGVSVKLQPFAFELEPEPHRSLVRLALNYLAGNDPPPSPEEKREAKMQEMLSWLGRVTVKSLKVRNLSVFPFQPTALKHPLRLRRLVLYFDEKILHPETRLKVAEMLSLFDNLEVLSVTCRSPFVHPDLYEVYRASVSSLLEHLRLGLQFKLNLKEVSVIVYPRGTEYWADWPGTVQLFQDLQPVPDFPKALRNLELHLPGRLYPRKATNWKSLLDGQEQLERLQLNLGILHWRSYCMALRKNSKTLRHLDICLSTAVNGAQLRAGSIPEDQWLDWHELATMLPSLESLVINKWDQNSGIRLRSLNFLTFDLPHLQRLNLNYFFLTQAEFEKIFFGLPSLKHVRVHFWSDPAEFRESPPVLVDTIDRAHRTCDVLTRALPLNRFQTIFLADYNIQHYPKFIRDKVPKLPNYCVDWPKGREIWLAINQIKT